MTLMEVLIVLALISVSMAAVVPNLMKLYQRDSLNRVNQSDLYDGESEDPRC